MADELGADCKHQKRAKANSRRVAGEQNPSSRTSGHGAARRTSSGNTGPSGSDGFGLGRRGPLGKDVREGRGG